MLVQLLLISIASRQQPLQAGLYAATVTSNGQPVVELRWLVQDGSLPQGGFNVFRTVNGVRETSPINPTPILPDATSDAKIRTLDPKFGDFLIKARRPYTGATRPQFGVHRTLVHSRDTFMALRSKMADLGSTGTHFLLGSTVHPLDYAERDPKIVTYRALLATPKPKAVTNALVLPAALIAAKNNRDTLFARGRLMMASMASTTVAHAVGLGFTDSKVTAGQTISYEVQLANGTTLGPSATKTLTVGSDPLPQPPTEVLASQAGVNTVALYWPTIDSSVEEQFLLPSYKVVRIDPTNPTGTLVSEKPVVQTTIPTQDTTGPKSVEPLVSFQDIKCPPAAQVTYKVTTVDGFGRESATAATVTLAVADWATPPAVKVVGLNPRTKGLIEWVAGPDTDVQYRVYRIDTEEKAKQGDTYKPELMAGNPSKQILHHGSVILGLFSWTDPKLEVDHKYQYAVTAFYQRNGLDSDATYSPELDVPTTSPAPAPGSVTSRVSLFNFLPVRLKIAPGLLSSITKARTQLISFKALPPMKDLQLLTGPPKFKNLDEEATTFKKMLPAPVVPGLKVLRPAPVTPILKVIQPAPVAPVLKVTQVVPSQPIVITPALAKALAAKALADKIKGIHDKVAGANPGWGATVHLSWTTPNAPGAPFTYEVLRTEIPHKHSNLFTVSGVNFASRASLWDMTVANPKLLTISRSALKIADVNKRLGNVPVTAMTPATVVIPPIAHVVPPASGAGSFGVQHLKFPINFVPPVEFMVGKTSDTQISDPLLASPVGQDWKYRIIAKDRWGTESAAAEIQVHSDPSMAPSVPNLVTALPHGDVVQLTLIPNAVGEEVTKYHVYRQPIIEFAAGFVANKPIVVAETFEKYEEVAPDKVVVVEPTNHDANLYLFDGTIASDQRYNYRVIAENKSGLESSWSAYMTGYAHIPYMPSVPANVTATTVQGGVTIAFGVAPDVLAHRCLAVVERSFGDGKTRPTWVQVMELSNLQAQESWTDKTPVTGQTYTYRVRFISEKEPSDPVSTTPTQAG